MFTWPACVWQMALTKTTIVCKTQAHFANGCCFHQRHLPHTSRLTKHWVQHTYRWRTDLAFPSLRRYIIDCLPPRPARPPETPLLFSLAAVVIPARITTPLLHKLARSLTRSLVPKPLYAAHNIKMPFYGVNLFLSRILDLKQLFLGKKLFVFANSIHFICNIFLLLKCEPS